MFEIVCEQKDIGEWLAHRDSGIGASEIAAAMGVSPWLSPLDLYLEKIGERESRVTGDEPYIRIGRALEPVVKLIFEEQTGIKLRPCGQLLRSTEHPWALATPDFITVVGGEPVESKGTGRARIGDWAEGTPPYYRVQLHQQMLVLGVSKARAAVLTADPYWTLLHDEVELDPELMADIIRAGEEFWDCVVNRRPPAPGGVLSSSSAIKALFPDYRTGKSIALPVEARDWDAELQVLKPRIKEDEARKRELEELIKFHIAKEGAEAGVVPGGASYRLSRIDIKAMTIERQAHVQLRLYRKEGG